MSYIGRFAPSPTGPLHFGSLVAALASYLDARANHGTWLLRIEDIDPPRESAKAPGQIVEQLQAFGLAWDGEILFQGARLPAYEAALADLTRRGLTYHCTCSRRDTPPVYPGTCRDKHLEEQAEASAVRVKVGDALLSVTDRRLGHQQWQADTDVGDFIIRRKDGLFAYQLAVVIDDIFQEVTQVVRGIDLIDSTPRQLALYHALGEPPPQYLHIPIVVDADGIKLSKQAHASPVPLSEPLASLRAALEVLGQNRQPDSSNVTELLAAAIDNWDTSRLPAANEITVPADYR